MADDECLGCTAVQLVVCLGGGAYFASTRPFRGDGGVVDLKKHPVWFQRGVRASGVALIALGMFRVGEVAQIWYRRS